MPVTHYPKNSGIVYGMAKPLPLRGFPKGRVKISLRNTSFARAYVKGAGSFQAFYIKKKEGCWVPWFEIGRNVRELG